MSALTVTALVGVFTDVGTYQRIGEQLFAVVAFGIPYVADLSVREKLCHEHFPRRECLRARAHYRVYVAELADTVKVTDNRIVVQHLLGAESQRNEGERTATVEHRYVSERQGHNKHIGNVISGKYS